MDYNLRKMTESDINETLVRLRADFPVAERAPTHIVRKYLKKGIFQGYALVSGDTLAAYSINVVTPDFALLNYLAVDEKMRGSGIGSIMLEKMRELYKEKSALIAEVEHEEGASDDERKTREARIRYYQRAGFNILPGVDYSIFGVKMHLMFQSETLSPDELKTQIFDVMKSFYHQFLPRIFWGQLKLKLL